MNSSARQPAERAHSDDSAAAWCEYARRTDRDSVAELLAELKRLDPTGIPAKILRLRAHTLGVRSVRGEHGLGGVRRVAIFAGAAGSMPTRTAEMLEPFLKRALMGYDGVVISGGTAVGLPGVIGRVSQDLGLDAVGYVPAGRGDARLYPRLRETSDEIEFSEHEPLAMWEDILGSGIPVHDVRVVVCPGGQITIAELLLARALGAQVAWLDLARDAPPLEDLLGLGTDGVLQPPADTMTLRAFLKWSRLEPEEIREPVAHHLHNSLAQADDIPNKLALVGKRLHRSGAELRLTEAQIALLAELEHGRHNIERLSGSRPWGERAGARSISLECKPWHELDDEARGSDRAAVTSIGAALREAGWGVIDAEH